MPRPYGVVLNISCFEKERVFGLINILYQTFFPMSKKIGIFPEKLGKLCSKHSKKSGRAAILLRVESTC